MTTFTSGNIQIRPLQFAKAGDGIEPHNHFFDHTTYCVRGRMRVTVRDVAMNPLREVSLGPGEWALVEAGKPHSIVAEVDDTLGHCIFSHRDPQGDVVQQYTGWEAAYGG
jgi:quercetin dioxygenase-like cupin family protein